MNLSIQKQQETGAFYTPTMWAELAVQYIHRVVPCMDGFLFWDMAAGEGALLEALPVGVDTYATTLEYEDVELLREKGIMANQFDFLDGNLGKLEEVKNRNIIVFTNPPFVKLPASHDSHAKRRYGSNDATVLFLYRIFREVEPVLTCTFSKMDIYQAQAHIRFRGDVGLFGRVVRCFLLPSKTWGLRGNFPIAFSIFV